MILDANVWLGHWPFDDLEPDTSRELVAHQASLGINLSSVASLDAVFYRNPMSANRKLFRELRDNVTLEPVAVVNPVLANWSDALDHYVDDHHCRQIRLTPNYHGYDLFDPFVDELLDAARELGVKVSIQVRLEDERAHHPLMKIPGVPVESIAAVAERRPDDTYLVLCAYRNEALKLAGHPNLLLGISHVEYLDTLNSTLRQIPAEQLVFASHTPLFVTRAALAKVEQCTADLEVKKAVMGGNLAGWLDGDPTRIPWLEE